MAAQWNLRNPAVKRIVQELKEIQRDHNPDILAEAMEDNIFEWHFVIRGAWDTEFEGGIYHGRILMPAEYPFKPPAFVMLTPSGRFEIGTKICLSISSYHPESWQPSWSVRSALVALIAFMQTPGNGAVGSVEAPTDARRQIATEARNTPPKHANADRQALINTLHQRMLDMEEESRQLSKSGAAAEEELEEVAAAETNDAAAGEQQPSQQQETTSAAEAGETAAPEEAAAVLLTTPPAAETLPVAACSEATAAAAPAESPPGPQTMQQRPSSPLAPREAALQQPHPHREDHSSWEDRGLTYLAALLVALLAAVLLRRVVAWLPSGRTQAGAMFSVNPRAAEHMEL